MEEKPKTNPLEPCACVCVTRVKTQRIVKKRWENRFLSNSCIHYITFTRVRIFYALRLKSPFVCRIDDTFSFPTMNFSFIDVRTDNNPAP